MFLAKFGHCAPDLRYRLYKTFCMSVYGSNLWDFDSKYVSDFFCAWRKCVRRVWGLPYTTHCNLLPAIAMDFPVEFQIYKRFFNFFKSAVCSENSVVRLCAKLKLAINFVLCK